jgi:hypothetical protein
LLGRDPLLEVLVLSQRRTCPTDCDQPQTRNAYRPASRATIGIEMARANVSNTEAVTK